MRYYATGTVKKKDSASKDVVAKSVLIPLTETNRASAVNQANRIAKRDGITDVVVRPEVNSKK